MNPVESVSGSEPSHVPQVLGPYQLEGVLGSGGMGVVFLARHRDSGERVALKTVRVTRESLAASIRWEVRALGGIHHPGVVRVLDSGMYGGLPWYAMELVEGRTLQQLIERYWSTETQGSRSRWQSIQASQSARMRSPHAAPAPAALPALPLLKLVRRLCSPLAYLHGSGLVHRDLKPGNIFVRADGTVVLGDFGVATAFGGAHGREVLQVDEGGLGTLLYMAPEQIQGDLVDARADLYSLGCILYECVTGFPPFVGGTSGAIRKRHLRQAPMPPSELLDEPLPERMEWLILKLLEKRPEDRLGYAEDVDRVLAELGVEGGAPDTLPQPRPYLYRSLFTGREEAMRRLRAGLDALAEGRGGRIFIGGGSGVGKTRLAMELAREALFSELTVVTGECIPLGLSGTRVDTGMRASPLHPFRLLLALVADRCRGWGEATTARILGPRGKVLVPFEPALDALPGQRELPPPPPLAHNAAERARIFTSLQEVLFAFSEEEPLLLILDDLQWADELTLGFLEQLRHEELVTRGVLLLGTYRMEEMDEPLHKVVSAQALHLELGWLGEQSIRGMVCGMLALRSLPPDFEGLVRQSEGNPFFVAEYLRAAITEGLLHRDASGQWRLVDRPPGSLEALPLPESIAEIIHRRLRGLDGGAQVLVELAAVLGREFDTELLLGTVPLGEEESLEALEALRVRQILVRAAGDRLRFIHDKLREFSYAGIPAGRCRQLHHRAAEALERRYTQAPDATLLPALAHHWERAEVHAQASHYFGLAGEHARATYANGEAISFYQSALAEAEQGARESGDTRETEGPRRCQLLESLGDVLVLTGRQEQAREAYAGALVRRSALQRCHRASLYRKVGKTWETHHQHEAALRAYDEAEAALGTAPVAQAEHEPEAVAGWWREWVQIQMDRTWVHYWLAQVDELAAVIDKAKPVIEQWGTPLQRAHFFQSITHMELRRERYAASARTVRYARASLVASEETGNENEICGARFALGFSRLFSGSLTEAEVDLRGALQNAERMGDVPMQCRCLTYLMVTYRKRVRVEDTRGFAERALAAAQAAKMMDYVGAAHANLGWAAWRAGDLARAGSILSAALETWRALAYAYPFQWMALLPLVSLELARGRLEVAAAHAGAMLEPNQQRLPDELSAQLEDASRLSACGRAGLSQPCLEKAITLARQLSYL